MNNIDIIIVGVYLIALFSWAIYLGMRETSDDFLVLSRKAPIYLILFSVVSTWVGTGTTVATAASGYDTGISLGLTAACGGVIGVLVAAWFAPRLKWFGDKYKAHTLGDFFYSRYSKNSHFVASGIILLVYLLLTAAQFVGLATILEVWTGVEFEVVVWCAASSTILYTAFAGIKSDFYTDIIHFFVMFLVLFLVLLPITLTEIGGLKGLLELPNTYFNPFEYGGISFFLAGLIFGGGSVFVTMELWQRIYASSSGKNARIALGLSAIIIVAFYVVSAVFGMAMYRINPNLINRDQALFILMKEYLPIGLLGLGLAGFMAIFISTINSTIMVASATLTKDFYMRMKKSEVTNKRILIVARVSTLICGLLGVILAILIPDLVALSVNALFSLLVLLPAVVGGFFWSKATEKGAITSVLSGGVTLIIFLSIDAETAFVPGFLVSLLTFIFFSLLSSHSKDEDVKIVRGWKE